MQTDHENFCKRYFEIVLKTLKSKEAIDLSSEDKRVIEYYLKDVSQHPVSANATIQECVHLFQIRVKLLKDDDEEEWDYFDQSLITNAPYISERTSNGLRIIRKLQIDK